MLLSDAWQLYAADKRVLGYSPHTLKAYAIQQNLLIRHLGDIDIQSITLLDLKEYLAAHAERLKPASLGHRIRFIRSFFRWATDEGYIEKNPGAKLREPKTGQRIPKALNEDDTEMLREACVSPLEHAIVEFMYTTGCRIGELHRMDRNTIDWENRSCVVMGKGNKEREVYFNTRCRIWLKKYLAGRKDEEVALFVTERRPYRRMSIAQIRYIVKRIAKRAGIEANVYPHKLRHSYATHLLNNGAPMEGIQTLLGHEKLDTTLLYAHLSGPRRKEIYTKYF